MGKQRTGRRPGRPATGRTPVTTICLRLSLELTALVDAQRGDLPRTTFIRRLIERSEKTMKPPSRKLKDILENPQPGDVVDFAGSDGPGGYRRVTVVESGDFVVGTYKNKDGQDCELHWPLVFWQKSRKYARKPLG